MPTAPQLPKVKIKELFTDIKDFSGGSFTDTPDAKADTKYALDATNLMQYSDNVWKTRPGTQHYGVQVGSETSIDGATEFELSDGSRLIIVIAGGKLYKSADDGATYSEVSGATFTAGNKPYFMQARSTLYISNRVDAFATYDGTTLAAFTGIDNPDAPTVARGGGLSAGSYNNYYRIQAINFAGFTEPSDSTVETTDEHRETWSDTDKCDVSWSAVSDAKAYQIFWGDSDGEEVLIAEVDGTTLSFEDTGETDIPANDYIETADDNTTAGVKFGPMEISGNRMWGTFDPDNEWRVYASGTGKDFARFSSFYGGSYADLEKGGKYKPISVVHYRTGKGDPIVTVLCKSPDGQGTTFQIELTSFTVGDITFPLPIVYKIVGAIGSDAPGSVIKAGNSIMFANKKGIYFLRNQAQLFQILSSDDSTKLVRNRYQSINQSKISDVAAYWNPPKAYYTMSSSSSNDTTAVYDSELNNWAWAWTIGFKQFFEYTDTSGTTHFLAVPTTGGKLVEISDNFLGDLGTAFVQRYTSPVIPVSDDKTDKGKVKYAIFEIARLQGSITCQVIGLDENGQLSSINAKEATSTYGDSGWSDEPFSDVLFSDATDTPSTFTSTSQNVTVRLNRKVKSIQFQAYSNTLAKWELLRVQAKGVIIPGRPKYN